MTALLAVRVAAPSGSAAEVATPYLPSPTGPHPVGTTSLHLKDVSRPDPWVPWATARELMVSLWYPAKSPGSRRARYMTPKESELLLTSSEITSVPPDLLSRTRTNAYTAVEPAGGKRPLVVLSPGFPWPRSSLTALAEELASHGYLVVAIDHTYENYVMTFPDGRVVTCAACGRPDVGDFEKAIVEGRARDVPFVLDELIRKYPKRIDRSRIAMAGMSMGGVSVGETMLADPRVRAGINLDGRMFKDLPERGLSRPFLIFGHEGPEDSWDLNWPRLTGWKRWLTVAGSIHPSFTDYDLLTQQIGVEFGGKLVGTRSVEITRRYVRAFFDLHLRVEPQSLLDRPSPQYPEVKFCAPETC
ncbi:alpha/beta hydrolase family protein [Actinokineospora fastidiosa]|uniref:alpha/beta hydrolase family protein n=1 Tax=Actinokineospora fastidiosa TaxID=1816 RepID=UPI001E53ADD6|nr:alpha/beta hydrolase [Actinokineospora fastidiosa]